MFTAGEVADALLALEEPWQSRFLVLVANMAIGWNWNGRGGPTREEALVWLEDQSLRRDVVRLLRAWNGG